MIKCSKCQGKVFVDMTYTENRNYEAFCLRCGKRYFVGPADEHYKVIADFVRAALVG